MLDSRHAIDAMQCWLIAAFSEIFRLDDGLCRNLDNERKSADLNSIYKPHLAPN
jgi:hypothetical protein